MDGTDVGNDNNNNDAADNDAILLTTTEPTNLLPLPLPHLHTNHLQARPMITTL